MKLDMRWRYVWNKLSLGGEITMGGVTGPWCLPFTEGTEVASFVDFGRFVGGTCSLAELAGLPLAGRQNQLFICHCYGSHHNCLLNIYRRSLLFFIRKDFEIRKITARITPILYVYCIYIRASARPRSPTLAGSVSGQ